MTSWRFVVSESGKGFEEYEYSFFCGGQDLPSSYRSRLDSNELDELIGLIKRFDSAPEPGPSDFVIDDAEQIEIETPQRRYVGQATTLAWMASRGQHTWDAITPLWPVLRLYEFFRGRLHYEAFAGIDCRPLIASAPSA
jgi:hypothetical protein